MSKLRILTALAFWLSQNSFALPPAQFMVPGQSSTPAVSSSGNSSIYYDSGLEELFASINTGSYTPLCGVFQKEVQFVDTAATSSSGTGYTTTSTSASITPVHSADRVKIFVTGTLLSPAISSETAYATIFRGSTDLSNGNGFCTTSSALLQDVAVPCGITYIDSPGTTSSTTYTVKIKISSGTATWNNTTSDAVIILDEIE